jgi:undecaprenyl diphosphate synthase
MNDGIEVLTVYAFSTENWSRDPLEVQTLMTIFAKYAQSFKQEALSRNVRVRVISTDFDRLPPNVIAAVHVSIAVVTL